LEEIAGLMPSIPAEQDWKPYLGDALDAGLLAL